jgi:hypothetical protein
MDACVCGYFCSYWLNVYFWFCRFVAGYFFVLGCKWLKQDEIALLYHNPNSNYQADTFTLDNFLEHDNAFNDKAGIYELDKTAKQLKEILNKAIDDIASNREANINFNL